MDLGINLGDAEAHVLPSLAAGPLPKKIRPVSRPCLSGLVQAPAPPQRD